MIRRILELFAVALIIMAENGGSLEPVIGIKQICRTTVEVTCSFNNGNRGIWNIYKRRDGTENVENIAKIDDSTLKCHATASKLYKSTKCICFETYITCSIYDDKVGQTGHQWGCSIFMNGTNDLSKPHSFALDNVEECTTTHVPAHVTEESNSLFTTGSIGRIEDTENVFKEMEVFPENITTERFKMATIQIENDVEEIERKGSHNKPDITKLALMIAVPFIAFDIGLIMCIYRKRLLSCLGGKHYAKRTHTNTTISGDRNINMNTECNNDACSNCNSPSNERARMRQPTAGPDVDQISIALDKDQQTDTDIGECIEDDPLYSRVQGNVEMCEEAGACGFTLHGEECTRADPVYIDIDNNDAHYATVKRDGPPSNKTHTGKRLFATRTKVTKIENEDPLYSKGMNDMCQSPSYNPIYPPDNAAIPHNGDSSYSSEDPLYSVVSKSDAIYSLAKNIDPLYSTVRKKKQIFVKEQSSGAFDTVAIKDDPLYSVVDKTNRDAGNDWNTSVPPAPLCPIYTYPPYNKVNKKKTQRVDTDGTTEDKS